MENINVIKPSVEILALSDDALKLVEVAGRTCYKSEDKIEEGSDSKFVNMIVNQYKHQSVLEHTFMSVRFICDRGITHEIVRHRHGSYSQESTRYCNYTKGKFDGELTFIKPLFYGRNSGDYLAWQEAMQNASKSYKELIARGSTAQQARSVLPNSLKTEIVVSGNFRFWLEFFILRCAKPAHPQMRELVNNLCKIMKMEYPEVFGKVEIAEVANNAEIFDKRV